MCARPLGLGTTAPGKGGDRAPCHPSSPPGLQTPGLPAHVSVSCWTLRDRLSYDQALGAALLFPALPREAAVTCQGCFGAQEAMALVPVVLACPQSQAGLKKGGFLDPAHFPLEEISYVLGPDGFWTLLPRVEALFLICSLPPENMGRALIPRGQQGSLLFPQLKAPVSCVGRSRGSHRGSCTCPRLAPLGVSSFIPLPGQSSLRAIREVCGEPRMGATSVCRALGSALSEEPTPASGSKSDLGCNLLAAGMGVPTSRGYSLFLEPRMVP